MGIKDQFQDKSRELQDKAKAAMDGSRDEASERARQAQDKAQDKGRDAMQEQQDKFDMDYDA
ncbi:hypothetical protein AB0C89_29275 [Streptomyces sp. NPDC048491]|uniref:hypothetical protein n=1 Tax=Streptomyces TaxID=1883 RepID=UPI000C280C00|nr:hypothetical protein [Streptomyces sp. CB01201]MBX7467366.1 hypothetical protein [Streptomyces sp. MAG02]PJN03100.1 hypothetical protein CG740_11135 [Streptomyces sp. CB01201]